MSPGVSHQIPAVQHPPCNFMSCPNVSESSHCKLYSSVHFSSVQFSSVQFNSIQGYCVTVSQNMNVSKKKHPLTSHFIFFLAPSTVALVLFICFIFRRCSCRDMTMPVCFYWPLCLALLCLLYAFYCCGTSLCSCH